MFARRRPFTGGSRGKIAGPIRVAQGRFRNDDGFLGIHAISEFSAVWLVLNGREDELRRRLSRAASARRNVARVFMMASNLFSLSPFMPGYWTAVERAVMIAAEYGIYLELCLFADAQMVMPDAADRERQVQLFATYCAKRSSVIPQLCNEPNQNGFSDATDPALLTLADRFAQVYGSRDFSIGDPPDDVEEATGEPLGGRLETLAQHSTMLVLHDSRKEDPARFARWVDHLKGMHDFRSRSSLRNVAFWHDEPMGMAGVRDVPLGNNRTYRREDRADALIAAACVAAVTQSGFTTHYISEQNDVIPGLEESAIAADIPQTPEWQFFNAGTGGSPVTAFTGFEKVRPSTNGREAWAIAYGQQKGSISWASGYNPERVYSGPNAELWKATK